MNELDISCDMRKPQEKKKKIIININNNLKEKLLYKYMVGYNGIWNTIKDFTEKEKIEWDPMEDGKYVLMVQAKRPDSSKSFDYVSRMDYVIGNEEKKLINNVHIDKDKLVLGDKLIVTVDTDKFPIMFRYWIKVKGKREMIRDYSPDNTLSWVAKTEGKCEVLVECKNIDSKKEFDDFKNVKFQVMPLKELQITEFKCLTSDLLENCELVFQVDSEHDKDRIILYKFFKISSNGEIECIQNYSTRRIVSYVEPKNGDYKLLCMAKDMYSINRFDDRAILNFNVKKYSKIYIKNFTANINYPQLCGTRITLIADTIGGKELLYRYIIQGSHSREDSGYTVCDSYIWESKVPGNYTIILMVKDKSFSGEYEAIERLNYIIDEKSRQPVKIERVMVDKDKGMLRNQDINVKVNASGGIDIMYSFIIRKNGSEVKKVKYSKNSIMRFTPEQNGNYEVEAMVKDKYSDREYDSHSIVKVNVFDYMPAVIDYILYPMREYRLVGERVIISCITQDTKNIVVKYILSINNRKVEETDFVMKKSYTFVPRYSGTYKVEILAKNIKSSKQFDCKRSVDIVINEAPPVTNTSIVCDDANFFCNEPVTFTIHSQGGKYVVYEFYIMESGDWNLVQGYSKKNYYTFIPFHKEQYKVLVLSKSQYSKDFYEDYDVFSFKVR